MTSPLQLKKDVVKHSATIHISSESISLLQRKIWNVLLANAYDDLLVRNNFSIKIKDLAGVLDFDSKNIEFLKESISKMQTILVQWNILNKDREAWVSSQFLGEVVIEPESGIIKYGWGPELKKRLHNPVMYAKISLAIQSRFKSKYSLILYELCLDYFIRKQGKGETPWISVEDFKKLMGVEKDKYYNDFKRLNNVVIKKAVKEINEESDIHVELDVKRETRKVVALKFHISPTEKIKNVLTRFFAESKQREIHFEPEEERKRDLYERMTKYFCLSEKQAEEVLDSAHDLDQVEEILGMVERKIKREEILNIGAYTFKALKEDYRPKKSFFEIEKEQEAQEIRERKIREEKEKEIIEGIRKEYEDYKERTVDEYLRSLTKGEKNSLMRRFEESLSDFMKGMYRESGLKSTAVKKVFTTFVSENVLGENLMTFAEFAREKGYFLEQAFALSPDVAEENR